jgi:hypothetical protein
MTSQPYNFYYLKLTLFESPQQRPHVSKLDVKSAQVYLLKDVISKQECQYYIEQSENFGYESLDKEYPSVRSNDFLKTHDTAIGISQQRSSSCKEHRISSVTL